MQARFLIPMVVSLATGILFSTLVILFLVPCLVIIVEDIKALLYKIFIARNINETSLESVEK